MMQGAGSARDASWGDGSIPEGNWASFKAAEFRLMNGPTRGISIPEHERTVTFEQARDVVKYMKEHAKPLTGDPWVDMTILAEQEQDGRTHCLTCSLGELYEAIGLPGPFGDRADDVVSLYLSPAGQVVAKIESYKVVPPKHASHLVQTGDEDSAEFPTACLIFADGSRSERHRLKLEGGSVTAWWEWEDEGPAPTQYVISLPCAGMDMPGKVWDITKDTKACGRTMFRGDRYNLCIGGDA